MNSHAERDATAAVHLVLDDVEVVNRLASVEAVLLSLRALRAERALIQNI